MPTHYETLDVPREANAEQIKRSYHRLAKMYHPDRFPHGSEAQAQAEKRIRELNAAYMVLSKPLSRASYDAKFKKTEPPYRQAEPEHCARCGKQTGYWDTLRKTGLCYRCTETIGPRADYPPKSRL
jgi:DnaJ-class molecular chaperone